MNLNQSLKIHLSPKFEYVRAITLKIIQVSVFSNPKKLPDTLEAKVCRGNNLEQWLLSMHAKCNIKVKKIHFIIFWRFLAY